MRRMKWLILVAFAFAGTARMSVAVADTESTVTCKDGSTSKGGKGACSHHGGVAAGGAAEMAPPAGAPAPAPAGTQGRSAPPSPRPSSSGAAPQAGQPTARCKDNSISYSVHHAGACSHHGGVAQWLQ
jgi:Protein of unknown function (DUF3761)